MELHVASDAKKLSEDLAAWITNYISETLATQDKFTFVLSGGSTPKMLYALLAAEPCSSQVPWEKIHFFWGDERAVPFEDERNNARMCYQELLDKVPVNAANIHVMRTDISPEDSAKAYETTLKSYFGETGPSFDLVLLGMGDDGHTLSLFPGQPVVHEADRDVTAFFLEQQDMYRITLTAPVTNRARAVVFLAAGAGKADTLKHVLEGERNIDLYPSQIINPEDGRLLWYVDEAAAAKLSN